MKKLFASAIIMALFATFLVSCSKDNDDNNNATSSSIATVLSSGTWTISSFNDHGTDRTSDYTGYTFTFEGLNYSAAILGSVVTNGTWATTSDNSTERVLLDYGTTPPLSALKNTWVVSGKSTVQVQLRDTDASGAVNYELTFNRIIR